MAELNKITFSNKENFVNTNSIYVINGDNVNEIKEVTNNLIDEFIKTNFKFNDVFKFIAISFKDLKFFSLKMNINLKFSFISSFSSFQELDSKENPDNFYVFTNGKYEKLSNITLYDENSILLIDISKINNFENANKNLATYYCKYYVYNDSTKSNEFGISLSNTDYFEKYQEKIFAFSTINTFDNSLLKYDESMLHKISNESYLIGVNEEIELRTYLIKSDEIIDITDLTTYTLRNDDKSLSINENIVKCSDDECDINEISCKTIYNENVYYSKINIEIISSKNSKNFNINMLIDSTKIIPNNTYDIDFEFINGLEKTLYSQNPEHFTLSYDSNILNISNNKISTQYSKNCKLMNIDVYYNDGISEIKKAFPIFIDNKITDFIQVNLENTTFFSASSNNSFKVSKKINNELIDITSDENLSIFVLSNILNDDNNFVIEFDKSSKTFKINDFICNKEFLVVFKYYDTNLKKYFYAYESLLLDKKLELKDIIVNFPKEISLNEKLVYSIVGKYTDKENNVDYNIDLTNKVSLSSTSNCLTFNEGIVEITQRKLDCVCKLHNYNDLIFMKYNEDSINFERIIPILLKYKQQIGIEILGDTILSGGLPSNPYSVNLIYDDGSIEDISESPNLFLTIKESNNTILDDKILTPGLSHNPFNIILNAHYEDELCLNKSFDNILNVYVLPFNLTKTTLNGDNEIITNKTKMYTTDAYYSNGWIFKNVYAKYSLSDMNGNVIDTASFESPVTFNFINNDQFENTLEIYAKKTLIDKTIILSSYYEEPDYEDTENSLISKEILIKGGFEINLSGKILIYNETLDEIEFINFSSLNNQLIKSVNDTNFNEDFILSNYKATSNLTFDKLKNLNTSGNEYHLIEIIDKDKNVIKIDYNSGKIFSSNKNINTSLKKNNIYDIRFYDVLKSSRLSDHEDYINNTNGLSIHDDVICSYSTFDIDKSINDSYILGLSDLYFEDGFYPLYIVSKFETSAGVEYKNEFSFNKENNMWLIDGIPLKATKLKDILIAFAFRDNEI
jgi:hypothetical protein